jgi:TonB family protein
MSKHGCLLLVMLSMVLAGPVMAQVPACADGDAPVKLKPIMSTHTIPPYPEVSVMTSEQGTVLLGVVVGKDGVATDVQIDQSSGSLRLDIAARDHVKANWRWEPIAQACRTKVSMKFDVRDGAAGPSQLPIIRPTAADYPPQSLKGGEQGDVIVMMLVGGDGSNLNTHISHASGYPALDAKSEELAKALRFKPAMMDDKPILTAVTLDFRWVLPVK